MNKLNRIISAILIVFALSSLVIYRLRLGDRYARQPQDTSHAIKSEIKMIEGQIYNIDTESNTLILIEGSREVAFDFDGRTAIVESGRAVQPASLPRGASVKVKYTQKAGKNWARKIELLAVAPSEPTNSY
jgi:hypothetical protein